MMSFGVVLLNWNGAEDTLDCVESLREGEPFARLIIVDNGSSAEQRLQLRAGLERMGLTVRMVPAHEVRQDRAAGLPTEVVLVQSEENLGFAKGCNLGLMALAALGLPWTVFLNNDTVIEAGALTRLVTALQQDPAMLATVPLIGVHATRRVWNAGGTLWPALGLRRYHFVDERLDTVRNLPNIDCSFVTGCCMAIQTERMVGRGGFSERFFFGEEDMEFSLWMHDQRLRARCIPSAVVWHKVSAAVDRASGHHAQRRIHVHYLNRLIHLRLRWGNWRWKCWLCFYLPYTALVLWKNGIVRAGHMSGFLSRLVCSAASRDRVDRETFEGIMSGRSPGEPSIQT